MASGNYLVDFVSTDTGVGTYTFPTTQSQIRDNFSDMVPRTVRIPGADGGFDQFGEEKAPSEIGLVSVTFEQYPDTRNDLQTLRDAVRAMAAWGTGYLTKNCGSEGERYCIARVNSITMTEAPNEPIGGMKLIATVDFQVSDPYWQVEYNSISLPNVTTTTGANNTPNAVTLDGLFSTYPTFTFQASASITDVGIFWTTGSASIPFATAQFKLESMPALAATLVIINCATMSIRLVGSSSGDGFKYATWDYANFVKLRPGVAYNLYIWVATAGTVTASRYDYEARY